MLKGIKVRIKKLSANGFSISSVELCRGTILIHNVTSNNLNLPTNSLESRTCRRGMEIYYLREGFTE